jgi:antitoxin MazE
MFRRGKKMQLQIAKRGNGLAICIPSDVAQTLGFKEGDIAEGSLTEDGGLTIRAKVWYRKAYSKEISIERDALPSGYVVMDELRSGGSY